MKNHYFLSCFLLFFLFCIIFFYTLLLCLKDSPSPLEFPIVYKTTPIAYKQIFRKVTDSLNSSVNVILLTYMRSGSTLLGEIFKNSPDVFYFYEPFRVVTYRSSNMTDIENAETAKTNQFKMQLFKMMKELFNCSIATSFIPILKPEWAKFAYGNLGPIVLRSSFNHTLDQLMKSQKVLDAEIAKCRAAKFRVIKTIRVNGLESIWDEVQSEANIKVIHLIRDPRGVQSSRLRLAKGRKSLGPSRVCDEPMKSIHFNQLHELDARGRYYEIIFDHFAVNPVPKLKEMFSFLGMDLPHKVEHLVQKLTESTKKVSGGYNTRERNATFVAKRWEKVLSKTDKELIENDETCKQLIEYIYQN